MSEENKMARTPASVRVALAVALVLGLIFVGAIRMRTNELHARNEEIEAAVAAAKEEQARLKEELAAPFDDEYVKRVARRKLGYCMPGEIIYFNDLEE